MKPLIIKGLNEDNIRKISEIKKEPEWMLRKRIRAYRIFKSMPLSSWLSKIKEIEFEKLTYYTDKNIPKSDKWEDIPEEVREVLNNLNLLEIEKRFLAGLSTQFDSNIIYHKIKKYLKKLGVIYLDTDRALKKHEDLVREYFGKIVSPREDKFAALNTAVWSGGSFIYVPENTKVELPIHTFFRVETPLFGQFERTLIILDKGAEMEYIEGCIAPYYSSYSLHVGVAEILLKENARLKHIAIQNWSKNIYNFVIKKVHVHKNATIEWIESNIGSKITIKHPSILLFGDYARANILSMNYASQGQILDVGSKVFHIGKNTKSKIISKSISRKGGKNINRGKVVINKHARNAENYSRCDMLLLDDVSEGKTIPSNIIEEKNANLRYEAMTGKIEDEMLFYLMSRGFKKEEAETLIVLGFIKELIKEFPLEYTAEFNELIRLEIENEI